MDFYSDTGDHDRKQMTVGQGIRHVKKIYDNVYEMSGDDRKITRIQQKTIKW